MDNIEDAIVDPYLGANVSLLISSKSYEDFYKLYNVLINSSSKTNNVEILVKIDSCDNRYFDLLNSSGFKFKILSYPSYYKRYSSHLFFNDLGKICSGDLIWPLYEDFEVVRGDWYSSLINRIKNKKYKDNIFNVAIPMDNGKGCSQICGANIITREWMKFFGTISPFPNLDRWISELSREIKRYITIPESELLSHFPKGRRTLSKKQRKYIFYPRLKEDIKKFNNRG